MAIIKNPITVVSGGGPAPSTASEWGRLWFYPWTEGWSATFDSCEGTFDVETFEMYLEMNPLMEGETTVGIEYNYNYGDPYIQVSGFEEPPEFSDVESLTELGITLTEYDAEGVFIINIEYQKTIDTTGDLIMMELNESQWNTFGGSDSNGYSRFYPKILLEAVKKFEFGTEPTSTPDALFASTPNLDEIDFSHWNITTIGNQFLMYNNAFNSPIDLTGITSIGSGFMFNCVNYNQSIEIPSSVQSIGYSFMSGCNKFTGILTCNTSAYPDAFGSAGRKATLSVNNINAPAYTSGVRLAGTYASTWKSNLPDRTAPYRKLIDTTAS